LKCDSYAEAIRFLDGVEPRGVLPDDFSQRVGRNRSRAQVVNILVVRLPNVAAKAGMQRGSPIGKAHKTGRESIDGD